MASKVLAKLARGTSNMYINVSLVIFALQNVRLLTVSSILKMRYYISLAVFFWVPTIQGNSQACGKYDKIVDCLATSGVPQDFSGTDAFTQNTIHYNLRLNFTPTALAVPSTVPQVQSAVRCAAELGVKVNPRSGGHS